MPLFWNEIGLTLESMTNFENLPTPIPNPKTFFKPFSEIVTLGDGSSFGRGFPEAEMRWNIITREQRDQLRAFCQGASATVYIKLRTNDNADEYKTFQAVMHWTAEEERDARARLDFSIKFTHMIEVMS